MFLTDRWPCQKPQGVCTGAQAKFGKGRHTLTNLITWDCSVIIGVWKTEGNYHTFGEPRIIGLYRDSDRRMEKNMETAA